LFFTIHCTVEPAKAEELDQFILTEVKPYWLEQEGVQNVNVRGVGQTEWPARSITIEIDNMDEFRRALDSDERRSLKETLAGYATQIDASAWLRRTPLAQANQAA
jgi:hypothetical protein